jgi:hypothetical protein
MTTATTFPDTWNTTCDSAEDGHGTDHGSLEAARQCAWDSRALCGEAAQLPAGDQAVCFHEAGHERHHVGAHPTIATATITWASPPYTIAPYSHPAPRRTFSELDYATEAALAREAVWTR